ncbi:hypothetical protein THAOC_16326 [Thalassiosira oceanica]|uniref:Maf-like protein n=1 Tax=Thalassiosira oceanica TaxID=159749 RepID=K0SA57_THAOC|nr:hypothetical protein THAOC_16326 [Thalassiosira oceanica]|mmetsp:Transcript_23494/g.55494  ORF Transcript_23494/g.55494 Transcript_23494/m.55494 type:complete len:283 (+) Transcript_23494:232-1080(+)|eukprot:EJK63038.1 hypothetical protein THAOC_16326 [Thalassiosira oceanica]
MGMGRFALLIVETISVSFIGSAKSSRLAHVPSFLTPPPSRIGAAATKLMSAPSSSNPLGDRGFPEPLLLGSGSFTRKLILGEMGIPYHKIVRPIDEKSIGDRSSDEPADLVLTLAKAKMDHLVAEIQGSGNCDGDLPEREGDATNEWIVLTGDQVVTHCGRILEKPESVEEAKRFVAGYAEQPCSTVGSCVLTHLPSGIQVSGVDTATIHFKQTIDGSLVDKLLREEAPILSCAGGLMIEHPLVREHIENIQGTEDSVMGLSKDLVLRLLDELRRSLDDRDL